MTVETPEVRSDKRRTATAIIIIRAPVGANNAYQKLEFSCLRLTKMQKRKEEQDLEEC